jgi:hypothetical protein
LELLAHLFTPWLHLLILNTACEESRAVLIGHVLIDKEGKNLSVLNADISNIFVIRIEVAIINLNGAAYLTSKRNLV